MTESIMVPRDEWDWVKTMASLGASVAAICADRLFSDESPMGPHDIIAPHVHRLHELVGNDEVRRWLATELADLLATQPARPFHAPPPGWLGAEPEC